MGLIAAASLDHGRCEIAVILKSFVSVRSSFRSIARVGWLGVLLSRILGPAPRCARAGEFRAAEQSRKQFFSNLRQPGLRASPRFSGSELRCQLERHHTLGRAPGACASRKSPLIGL